MNKRQYSQQKKTAASVALCLSLAWVISSAQAAPQGGEITSGTGNIQTPDANTTLVTQQSQTMSINWQSLNLSKDETRL